MGSDAADGELASVQHRLRWLIGAAVSVVAVDQVTKQWALSTLDDGDIDLVWTLRFNLVFNEGAAFSTFSGFGPVLGILALVVVVVLTRLGRGIDSRAGLVGLGMVAGGALGNLIDRALRDGDGFLGGAVVDFIDLQWWPVFNVADMAIVGGGILLGVLAWRGDVG